MQGDESEQEHIEELEDLIREGNIDQVISFEEIQNPSSEDTPSLGDQQSLTDEDQEGHSSSHSSHYTMAVKTVKINGVDFEIEDAAQEVDTTEAPLFKKGDREALSPEKLNELFERIASGCKQKYQLPSMSLHQHLVGIVDTAS